MKIRCSSLSTQAALRRSWRRRSKHHHARHALEQRAAAGLSAEVQAAHDYALHIDDIFATRAGLEIISKRVQRHGLRAIGSARAPEVKHDVPGKMQQHHSVFADRVQLGLLFLLGKLADFQRVAPAARLPAAEAGQCDVEGLEHIYEQSRAVQPTLCAPEPVRLA
jgi:hypothetical protein